MRLEPHFIHHRINTVTALQDVPPEQGAEFDVRSYYSDTGLELHLTHDPAPPGEPERLRNLLAAYNARNMCGMLIVNTKEDGLEKNIMQLMDTYNIGNYIFLDTQIPTLRGLCRQGAGVHCAARLSDCESVNDFLTWPKADRPKWLWVDCFAAEPLPVEKVAPLQSDFKLCLVSPELHLKKNATEIQEGLRRISGFMPLANMCDAICTKSPETWKTQLLEASKKVPQTKDATLWKNLTSPST